MSWSYFSLGMSAIAFICFVSFVILYNRNKNIDKDKTKISHQSASISIATFTVLLTLFSSFKQIEANKQESQLQIETIKQANSCKQKLDMMDQIVKLTVKVTYGVQHDIDTKTYDYTKEKIYVPQETKNKYEELRKNFRLLKYIINSFASRTSFDMNAWDKYSDAVLNMEKHTGENGYDNVYGKVRDTENRLACALGDAVNNCFDSKIKYIFPACKDKYMQ